MEKIKERKEKHGKKLPKKRRKQKKKNRKISEAGRTRKKMSPNTSANFPSANFPSISPSHLELY